MAAMLRGGLHFQHYSEVDNQANITSKVLHCFLEYTLCILQMESMWNQGHKAIWMLKNICEKYGMTQNAIGQATVVAWAILYLALTQTTMMPVYLVTTRLPSFPLVINNSRLATSWHNLHIKCTTTKNKYIIQECWI
jgi:hypothetical protein